MRRKIEDQGNTTDFEKKYNYFSVKCNYFRNDMIPVFGVIQNVFGKVYNYLMRDKTRNLFKNC